MGLIIKWGLRQQPTLLIGRADAGKGLGFLLLKKRLIQYYNSKYLVNLWEKRNTKSVVDFFKEICCGYWKNKNETSDDNLIKEIGIFLY